MRGPVLSRLGGYVQIYGHSDGILLTNFNTQKAAKAPNGEPMVCEEIDEGRRVTVIWPDSLSVYKRGEIDDSAIQHHR